VVDGHEANVGHFGQARLNLQRSEIKRRQSGAGIIKRFSWSLMLRQNKLERLLLASIFSLGNERGTMMVQVLLIA
jgi:hypothetical protein